MRRIVAMFGVLAAMPTGAWGQATNSGVGIGPSLQVAEPSAEKDVAHTVEHLLGDLGGVRTNLQNQGIYLLLDATTELAGNFTGGVKQGATFANQVGFQVDLDWQRPGRHYGPVDARHHRQSIWQQ